MGGAGGLREVTWDVQVGGGNLQRRCGTCLDPYVVNHIHKGVGTVKECNTTIHY